MTTVSRNHIAQGALWIGLGIGVDQALRLLVSAVLARLLTPQEFGVVGMVLVFTGFLGVFSAAGLSSTVIQFQKLDHDGLSTLFWLSLFLGGLFSAGFAAASPLIARFYHLPELQPVSAVMGLAFLVSGLYTVPSGLLQQQLRFRTCTCIDISSSVAAAVVAIALALHGASYWALVVQSLVAGSLRAFLFFVVVRWRPLAAFRPGVISEVWTYSGNLTLFTAMNYWARNLDNLLIGRFLGPSSLGYYTRAYALMTLPMDVVTGAVGPTIHPVFAKMQGDLPRMYQAYLRLLAVIAMLSLPIMAALALLAPEFVLTLWGPQWDQSVPIFRILCVVGAIQPLLRTTGSVYLALTRADLLLKVGCIASLVVCGGIVAGLPWGLAGVAVGYSLAYALIVPPALYVVLVNLLKGRLRDLLGAMKSSFEIAAGVAIALAVFNAGVRGTVAAPLHLVLGLCVAFFVYLVLVCVLAPDTLDKIYALAPSSLHRLVTPSPLLARTLESLRAARWR